MSSEHDPLVAALVELGQELDKSDVPVILGGGMSHYLRLKFMSKQTSQYPIEFAARSTADLDFFLSSKVIVDREKMERLRDAVLRLGYEARPGSEHFIFVKNVDVGGNARPMQIDLMGAPPEPADKGLVDIDELRIKPKGIKGIHGRQTPESEGVDLGKRIIDVSRLGPYAPLGRAVLAIPSSYNYLILKAFALRDQFEDEEKDFGRHHAFDMFSTVARMDEEDWRAAKEHLAAHAERSYLKDAIAIVRDLFATKTSWGTIRLREFGLYRDSQASYDPYLDKFLKDLSDLFPG